MGMTFRRWIFCRRILSIGGMAAVLALAVPAIGWSAPQKAAPGSIVIVFKDGHRQVFNLADIERVEFPSSGEPAAMTSSVGTPSRNRFLGSWEVGDGAGSDFEIRLNEDGSAYRSIGNVHGTWVYVDGEARVTWNDGNKDCIRKVGTIYRKFAYSAGKSFTSDPDNETNARNTSAKPI
jgi:hypothetical protein